MAKIKVPELTYRIKRLSEINRHIARTFNDRYYMSYGYSFWYDDAPQINDDTMVSKVYFNDLKEPANVRVCNYDSYDFRSNIILKDLNYYIVCSERGQYFYGQKSCVSR